MAVVLRIDERRRLHTVSPMIYGQFIEHFEKLVYGGLFDPESPLADEDGFRKDVMEALRRLRIPVIRWPGGCFASAYHWKDGVGPVREPVYDKAWCVEEPNTFGTDEFMKLCEKLGCEPYICTNAGTGTPEEMADWVEYCNEPAWGKWAKARIRNGHPEPYRVKYWSIGNENYTGSEIGSKSVAEWGRCVRESAKMMRRVDPTIRLFAAAVPDIDWNLQLLREAGELIDCISLHGYFDPAWETDELSGYIKSLQAAERFERDIVETRGLLTALNLEKRIKIAYDEWNLRGWYHPGVVNFEHLNPDHNETAALRLQSEDDSRYIMADAVFSACFLNTCMRQGDLVEMANFSPTVCGRGLLGVKDDGIVYRPAYFVFEQLRALMGTELVDSYAVDVPDVDAEGICVPALDAAAALDDRGRLTLSLVNRDPAAALDVQLEGLSCANPAHWVEINGPEMESSNTQQHPDTVGVTVRMLQSGASIRLAPHSVNVLVFD